MEGPTLTFRFVEEGGGGRGPSVNPQQVATTPDSGVTDTQAAITQAGGVGNFVNQNNPAPIPSSTTFQVPSAAPLTVPPSPTVTTSSDPLLSTVSSILKADPKTTAEELAKALGIPLGQANSLMGQAVGTPSAPPLPTPPSAVPTPTPSSTTPPPLPLLPTTPPVPPPPTNQVPPPLPPTPPPVGQQAPPLPTPPANPNNSPSNTAQGVQNAIQALASLAQMGGPVAGSIANVGAGTAALPGVAGSLAAIAPGLAMAAPYVDLAGAAISVPTAALYSIESIAATARERLQGISGEVITAEVQADVRQILANFRTAARLGDEVGERIDARSRASVALQGITDVAIEPILQDTNNMWKGIAASLEKINELVQASPILSQFISGQAWDAIKLGLGGLGALMNVLELVGRVSGKPKEVDSGSLRFWLDQPLPELPPPFGKGGVPKEPLQPPEPGL